jgi:hypothetical protein
VKLYNGEIAVSVQRGARANTPWVVSIIDKEGMAISRYVCKETLELPLSIHSPVNFESVRVTVNAEKVHLARKRIPH